MQFTARQKKLVRMAQQTGQSEASVARDHEMPIGVVMRVFEHDFYDLVVDYVGTTDLPE